MKNIFILAFSIFVFSLHAEETKPIHWKGLNVSIKYWNDSENIKNTQLIMKDIKKKKIFEELFDHGNYSVAGFYKTKEFEYLHFSGYTGGESGCCSLDKFYYREGNKILSYEIETLAYSSLKIVDIDGDKDEEILFQSSRYYGLSVNKNELGNKSDQCSINTDKLYAGGFSEPIFPEFKILKKNKGNNKIELIDVTFEKKYFKALKPYFLKAESYLQKNNNKIVDQNLSGVLQYFYYMSELGKEEQALEKIKASNLKIKFNGPDDCNSALLLYDFINLYKKKLLDLPNNIE